MARVATSVLTAVVVLLGVWVVGGVVTDDATVAKVLTATWFIVSGVAAVLLARARRHLSVAVLGAWLVTSVAAGGFLLLTSEVDRVVDEAVVVAVAPTPTPTPTPSATPTSASSAAHQAVLEAAGHFRRRAHDTRGRVALVRTPDGRRVLTLTDFATAPGPDLRVYAVPGRSGTDGAVDLGRLKGNKGNQQYVVPPNARVGSVVIWCRAFSVNFGTAVLDPTQ